MNPAGLRLWLWTDDPHLACQADQAGVDRIGLDIERLGKAQRQSGHDTWISPHQLASLAVLRPKLRHARLFVRTNPVHPGSHAEIELALALGAQVLMLPNFTTLGELERYVAWVAGRAVVVPLVERVAATALVADFPTLGITEFHVGLNDLALEMGVSSRLRLLDGPVVAHLATVARRHHLHFGVGGVTCPEDDTLPVSPGWVIEQLARLGAQGAMLARSWLRQIHAQPPEWVMHSVARIRHHHRQAQLHWDAQRAS